MNIKYVIGEQALKNSRDDSPLFHLGMAVALCVQKHSDVAIQGVKVSVRQGNINTIVLTVKSHVDKTDVEDILSICPIVTALVCPITVTVTDKEVT
jgi:hypothetical protein